MTGALPWDRFGPDDPRPPSPLQPLPPAPTLPAISVGDIIDASVRHTVEALLGAAKDQAISYGRQTIDAVKSGQRVDHTAPTVTATTSDGKTLVVADAKSRSWRTFLQGLIIDLGFALTAILTTLAGVDPFAKETWLVFGALVVKTVVQTAVSYLSRLQVTPTIRDENGAKLALMPVARPMVASDRLTRRSNRDAEIAPLTERSAA